MENLPSDYVRNLNRNTQQCVIGNHCDSEKTTWAEQMHLASTFTEKPKIKNDYKISSPVNCDAPNRLYGGRSNTLTMKPNNPLPGGCDDDQRNVGCEFRFYNTIFICA